MLKKGLFLLALSSAVGVPYAATEWSKIAAKFTGSSAESGQQASFGSSNSNPFSAGTTTATAHTAHSPTAPHSHLPPTMALDTSHDVTPIVELGEALRFNITPEWVIHRWPRVTSGLPEENLHGSRVTLITGTRPDDLAGALTYYFNANQQCGKLTFSGTTGDPRRLIELAKERFGFHRFAGEPGVDRYEIRWNGKAHSELLIRTAGIVRSSSPHSRFEVQLSIVDPAVR